MYSLEKGSATVDPFEVMQLFIDSTYYQTHMMDMTLVCRLFGVSRSGYYAWLTRQRDTETKRKKAESEDDLKEKVRQIIRKIGFVPGARTLKVHFWRRFALNVGRKKCGQLLSDMHLVANRPFKDAYKHQATHDHPYASPADNLVNRNFYIGPRKVILTDITYLYYGQYRVPIYLCVFKDPYTRESLGAEVSREMSIEKLVRPAYEQMMKDHGSELKRPDVFIHSDQGSQYLSTSFRQMLEDDEFVQSVSRRGNSLDNSPMESMFSRLKAILLNTLARAKSFEQARELSLNCLHTYTYELFQYDLGGLTPAEFYQYVTTGVYKCDSYFGVRDEDLLSVDRLIEARKKMAAEFAEKARKKAEYDRLAGLTGAGRDPMLVVNRDLTVLKKQIREWDEARETAEMQGTFLANLKKRVEKAANFVANANEELRKALRNKAEWKNHKELSYIYDMKGLY